MAKSGCDLLSACHKWRLFLLYNGTLNLTLMDYLHPRNKKNT